MVLFLAEGSLLANDMANGGVGAGIFAALAGVFLFFLVIILAIWIYTSLAYMAVARKANLSSPGMAWIPGVGPLIIAFRASKMHWWPWLLLLTLLIMWIPVIGIILYVIGIVIFSVYSVIWHWKMFEAISKPGWWSILMLISPVNLIMIGIAAWSKD